MPDEYLKLKKIMMSRRKPIGLRLFSNILKKSDISKENVEEDNSVPELVTYPETFQGLIYSFADRMPFSTKLYNNMIQEWKAHSESLRVDVEGERALHQKEQEKKQVHQAKQ